ncbi:MAG: hypothetical protein WC717_03555 [Candidatus Micrarchaeia archaeon]|jgi:hypothetical protein
MHAFGGRQEGKPRATIALLPNFFQMKFRRNAVSEDGGGLLAGKPREWFEKLMREEPEVGKKGEPQPNVTRARLRPSAYAMMMKGDFPALEEKDYNILHPDDLQTLVCTYLAFFRLSEAVVALGAIREPIITLSEEQRALLEKAIASNYNIVNDFFEKNVLERFAPGDRQEILRLLIANKKMTYAFLAAHENEISKDDFRKVIWDLGWFSRTSEELDSLKPENRGSVLEYLIDREQITYSQFIGYSHELDPNKFNKAIISLLDRDEMWLDEALEQDPSKLDRKAVGRAILKKVRDDKMKIEVALEKYGYCLGKREVGDEIVEHVSKRKVGVYYAMQAFADGWMDESQLRNAIIRAPYSKEKISTAEALLKCRYYSESEKVLVLMEIRLGNMPTVAALRRSKRIGFEEIKKALEEHYLDTKKEEKNHDDFIDNWIAAGRWVGGVLGGVGSFILVGILEGWENTGILVAGAGAISGLVAGAIISWLAGKIAVPLRARHRARKERKDLEKAWLDGREKETRSLADLFVSIVYFRDTLKSSYEQGKLKKREVFINNHVFENNQQDNPTIIEAIGPEPIISEDINIGPGKET